MKKRERKKLDSAASRIQSIQRGRKVRIELQQQENSAVAIQKTVRGKIHRKSLRLEGKEKLEAKFASAGEDENLAATKVQSIHRASATRIE